MPLVFLPGAAGRADFWLPAARRLEGLGPATLVDYPGFGGRDPVPGVASLDALFRWLLERLPPAPVDLVAQSMGCVLALRLAVDHPARVRNLVLTAATGGVQLRGTGAVDWRPAYQRERPDLPPWFVDDATDLTATLDRIRAPTLLLWSDADPWSPPAIGRLLAARIRGARLAVLRGATHAFAAERPEEVAALIRRHLQDLPAARVTAAGRSGARSPP